MLLNWFSQSGIVKKADIEEDFKYMNDDKRIQKETTIVAKKLNIKFNNYNQ